MAIGSYLRQILSEKSPYSDDMRDYQKRHSLGSDIDRRDSSPQSVSEYNTSQEITPPHMKEYFKNIDDEGHASMSDKPVQQKSRTLEPTADKAAKSASDSHPYKQENLASFGDNQEPNDDIIKAMRKSILDALSEDYY
jgi:hypothetical protein